MIKLPLCLFALLFAGTCVAQQIYKSVDEYGNVTYSDEPPDKNAKALQLKPLNTAPPIEPRPTPTAAPATPAPKVGQTTPTPGPTAINYRLRMVNPKPDQRFGPADRVLTVMLLTDHKLEQGHQFQVFIDDQPQPATDSNNVNIALTKALQGRRQVSAAIVDGAGEIITQTKQTRIYVIRP